MLTIDVEEWFHTLDPDPAHWSGHPRRAGSTTRVLLDVLDRFGTKATFFVLGDVAQHEADLVREITARGHEIGSHGMRHRFVYRLSQVEFRRDLKESLELLGSITGTPVRAFRAPAFSITERTPWAFDTLSEEGIRLDSSIFPIRNYRYGIPSAPRLPHEVVPGLWEWPPSTVPTFLGNFPIAGGFYLRSLPLRLIRRGIRALESRGDPIVLYLHPWEIDPDQPRYSSASAFLNFRFYHNLAATKGKLEQLLQLARYSTLTDGMRTLTQK